MKSKRYKYGGPCINTALLRMAGPTGSINRRKLFGHSPEIALVQIRNNSQHTSMSVGANKLSATIVSILGAGMMAAGLADNTLNITMNVFGTTVVGSTNPADYTVHLYGPDTWVGGQIGKAGTKLDGKPIPLGFGFARNVPIGVERVLVKFQPNKTATFGADAALVELP